MIALGLDTGALARVVVDHLIDLADTAPMSQVRAIATHHMKALQCRTVGVTAAPDRAHRTLLASDIQRFLDRPSVPARDYAQPATPPGAPIGAMGMDFLSQYFGMCSVR